MTAMTFMTLDDYLNRLNHYRGQLRKHRYAERNAIIREVYESKIAAAMVAGTKPAAARASAIETASTQYGISPSQVRRVVKDRAYLMNANSLRRNIREIIQIKRDRTLGPIQLKRIQYYEKCLAEAIQNVATPVPRALTLKEVFDATTKVPKHTPTPNALKHAIKKAASDLGISETQLRRNLDAYGIPRRRNKK